MKWALLLLALLGCKHAGSSVKDSTSNDLGRDTPMTCDVGEYLSLSIVTDTSTPHKVPLIWSVGNGYRAVNATKSPGARIDVCFDETNDTAKVVRVVISKGGAPSSSDDIFLSGWGPITGLKEAIFADPSHLLIGQTQNFLYEIRGVEFNGQTYATLSNFHSSFAQGVTSYVRAMSVLVGRLEHGNIWGDQSGCQDGERLENRDKTIGSIAFNMALCFSQGAGNTSNYRYIRIQIKDPHPSLAQPVTVLEGAGLTDVVKVKIAHHNWGDRTEIGLPQVRYIFQGNDPHLRTESKFEAIYSNGEVFSTANF